MGLRIQNNVEAFNTHRQLTTTSTQAAKSMEKLSSGYRINRAADDAAGLAISREDARSDRRPRLRRSATPRTASRSSRRRKARSPRCTRCCSASVTSRSSSTTAPTAPTTRTRSRPRSPRSPRKSGTSSSDTKFNGTAVFGATGFTFQVGANDSETITTTAANFNSTISVVGGLTELTSITTAAGASTALNTGGLSTHRPDRHRDQERLQGPRRLRRGAEPPRASPEQPGHLPGEPDRVRVADPRRGHGGRDDEVHEAQHPAAGRHEHARAGQPGARRASCPCCASRRRTSRSAVRARPGERGPDRLRTKARRPSCRHSS